MPLRLSDAEFQAIRARGKIGSKTGPVLLLDGKPAAAFLEGKTWQPAKARTWQPRHKFNAQRTERDGRKFPSKAEAEYYDFLKQSQAAGRLAFFLQQVPIHIPGGLMRLDFLEFWADGEIFFTDVKGMILPEFELKRRAIETLYPFKLRTAKLRGRGAARCWEYS